MRVPREPVNRGLRLNNVPAGTIIKVPFVLICHKVAKMFLLSFTKHGELFWLLYKKKKKKKKNFFFLLNVFVKKDFFLH